MVAPFQAQPEASRESSLDLLRLTRLAPRPTTVTQTGLSMTFLADLLGKHLASVGVLTQSQLIERLALAGPIIEQILKWMRQEGRVEVRARSGMEEEMRFGLTERGRSEAMDAMVRASYLGPAPVPLSGYSAVVRAQTVHDRRINREHIRAVFHDVVLAEDLLDQLGPALNSGRALFIYGAAGTGKTYVAKRLATALLGHALIPHAIEVNGTVIRVLDPLAHMRVETSGNDTPFLLEHGFDPRYVLCRRPTVVSGGELSAEMLEVHCDPVTRDYNAPLQLKANNGLLLIDDLGRQRIEPGVLFNRWIVPMEEKRDYLTAGPGKHFTIPFDVVLVFSTNLNPKDLADDAFLRRIGYKIAFKPISGEQYEQIWKSTCAERNLAFDPRIVEFVIHDLHAKHGVPLLPCHPRDFITMAHDWMSYTGAEEQLTPEALRRAWENYFVESERAISKLSVDVRGAGI